MDPDSATTAHEEQQVMTAQRSAQPSPQHTGQLLEGEAAGPDYSRQEGARRTPQLPLPNGVPQSQVQRASPDPVEMESLHGSPFASGMAQSAASGLATGSAFYAEAWPAQPPPARDERGMVGGATRPGVFSPAAFSWVSRLGEFLRTQMPGAVETRTTLTRQQVVGASGEMVSREQLQHTTSGASSPQHRPLLTEGAATMVPMMTAQPAQDPDPPLFGPGARRVMEGWLQRAPLLHGPQPERAPTDPGSSNSIPREVVQEEVRRQVQEALESQRRHIDDLREENRRLREGVVSRDARDPSEFAGHRAYEQSDVRHLPGADPTGVQSGLGVPQGHRVHEQSDVRHVPGADPTGVQRGLGVPQGHRAYEQSDIRQVPSADPTGVQSGLGVPQGHRAYEQPAIRYVPNVDPAGVQSGLGVPQGHRAHVQADIRNVPGTDPAGVQSGLGVPQGHRANVQADIRNVPGTDPAGVQSGLGVPQGHRANVQADIRYVPSTDPAGVQSVLGVPQGHRAVFQDVGGGRRDGRFRSLTHSPPDEGSRVSGGPGRRTSSVDRRSSPLGRSPSRPPGFSSRLYGRDTEGQPGFGRGDQGVGLLEGGLRVPPVEAPYRPPGFRDSRTYGDYGDYGFERPPGLDVRADGHVHEAAQQPSAEQTAPRTTEDPPAASSGPSPMDVLITGMSQLQQVLLKRDVGDLEPKAVAELVKLPEYTAETGAIDFQDYLYLAEQQIGTLASGAGDWWARTLRVAQDAYSEYQTLSPVRRLNVKATLTEELKEEKYKKLERRVAALILASLPKGVRDDLVAYRVQGVHQILYRLMVIFQPGGAQDRAQLLKQLDVTESAAGPVEATAALRRWYRLLQRAADLGVKLPDESLQVKALSVVVKKTAEQNADFKFRLALARTELQIDTRPTQENVLRYLQHLLAELEQLGAMARKPAPASTTTAAGSPTATSATSTGGTAGTSLKGLQPSPEAKAKPKTAPGKKPCSWFGSDQGCKNGKSCSFPHLWTGLNRGERCLLCGSKQHRAKDCPTAGSSTTPEKAHAPARAARMQASSTSTATSQPSVVDGGLEKPELNNAASTTSGAQSSGGSDNKIDTARVTEILNETNKMLKALTATQPAVTAQATTVDPIEMIQRQLDEVKRLKVLRVKERLEPSLSFDSALSWYEARLSSSTVSGPARQEEGDALLDSGASHAYRPPESPEELGAARRVGVALATGEERALLQNAGGTLLSESGDEGTILPMGQLVTLLGCKVSWTPSKLQVLHPVHGKLQVRLRGQCPVLPVSQALTLIAELEQKRMASFERTVQELQQQLKVIKDRGLQAWTWRQHLQTVRESGERAHLAGFLHKNPVFSTVNAEVLLGIPETIPIEGRDGWKSCLRGPLGPDPSGRPSSRAITGYSTCSLGKKDLMKRSAGPL